MRGQLLACTLVAATSFSSPSSTLVSDWHYVNTAVNCKTSFSQFSVLNYKQKTLALFVAANTFWQTGSCPCTTPSTCCSCSTWSDTWCHLSWGVKMALKRFVNIVLYCIVNLIWSRLPTWKARCCKPVCISTIEFRRLASLCLFIFAMIIGWCWKTIALWNRNFQRAKKKKTRWVIRNLGEITTIYSGSNEGLNVCSWRISFFALHYLCPKMFSLLALNSSLQHSHQGHRLKKIQEKETAYLCDILCIRSPDSLSRPNWI